MNRPQVEQWIAALESGKYQQMMHYLRVCDRYCCLGVACDISGIGKWERGDFYYCEMDGSNQDMPMNVRRHFGIDRDLECRLQSMNDGGKSFAEIARYLRERLAQEEQQ